MTVPVSAVHRDELIDLSGSTLVYPGGDEAPLAGFLHVQKSYTGRPTQQDLSRDYGLRLATASENKDDAALGHTLLVTQVGDTRAILIHFASDQYEVVVVQDDSDDDW
ncbi:hypothetical protein FPZ24_05030 [Sphingomonas panacisoli]|uniref:Uncharacterized protein n=1 Tax=Sphingomonas panacisoli TaxID=1813879 RepID=A0A5B8LFU4_9SPHN|nr:hypothetical protein [Sphingomonas panacisoli]QDZ06923.1 hypothetical protein FPZ24_05030 [Sphingomonas panacisoli]